MEMKIKRKQTSTLMSLVLLLNLFLQFAVPAVAYAESDEPTAPDALSVADVLALEQPGEEVTVEGYIVGSVQDDDFSEEPIVEGGHFLLADDPTETDRDNLLYVELPESYEPDFDLFDNPDIFGKKLTLTGTFDAESNTFSDLREITLIPEETEPAEDETAGEPEGEEEAVEETGEAEEETPAEEEPVAATADAHSVQLYQTTPETFDLSLMHMNDTHARVNNYPQMVSAVNAFRSENPEALLLHAGDVFSGTLYFNQFLGQADLALLNLMDIDAMAFGNHEFDLGSSADGHAALAAFVSGAEFPFLGTNVDFSNDPHMASLETNASLEENPADGRIYDSIVKTVDGERIGIFGLTTEDTENIASPVSIAFSNYVDAAEEAVAEFEAAGIDKIIALTHIGYASSPDYGNDIVLANQVDGIDIIVGGHSHTALDEPDVVTSGESPTVIVQAGSNAENLGTLHVTFDENGHIIEVAEQDDYLISVSDYDPDPTAVNVLAPYEAEVSAIENEETGAVAVRDLENPRYGDGDSVSVRANETPLGNLITDAMLAKTQELYPETVIAFQNGGGIRAPIEEGDITVGEVIQVLPFGNNPVVVDLSGEEIKELLEISVGANQRVGGGLEENGGFLHVSGMEFYFDSTKPAGERVVAMYVVSDGQYTAIQPEGRYLVTTNAFTGQGGDGLTPFAEAYAEGRVQDTGAIDWEQLRDYMVEEQYLNGEVDPVVEGRINDLNGQDYTEYRLDQLRDRIAELEEALRNLETENEGLRDEIRSLQALLADLQVDLEDGNDRISELEDRLAELEARIQELEEAQTPEVPGEEPKEKPDESGQKPGGEVTNGSGQQNGGSKQDSDKDTDKVSTDRKPEKSTGKQLPKTGMSIVVPLVSGSTLLITGLGLEAYRRKNYKK